MFGGPPMMMPAQQFMPYRQQAAPPPQSAVPVPVASAVAAPRPAPPGPQPAQQTAPPRPIIRMQAAEEEKPLPDGRGSSCSLSIPPPEQLGVTAPQPGATGADWAMVHQRLEKLGATCFLQEKLATGGCRVTCLVPASKPGRSRRVEAQAGTVAEAARLVLDEAERWAGGQ